VIDREYSGSISTRKLIIETAKFNVLTAYSAREAIDTLARYPAVSGVVLDAVIKDMECRDLIRRLKQIASDSPVIAISAPSAARCDEADHQLESFEPAKLLELLRKIVPEQTAAIEAQNEFLNNSRE
jgi:CheY-like chemotaxis protein